MGDTLDVLVSEDNGATFTPATVSSDTDAYQALQHSNEYHTSTTIYRRVGAQTRQV